MKNIIKISMLGAAMAVFSTAFAENTLVDYLNEREVSFLIVNSGPNARLTTFGWVAAAEGCKTIRTAGFNVGNVRNFDAETNTMTEAVCKN